MKHRISFLKTALLITFIMGSINAIVNDTICFTLETNGGAINITISNTSSGKQFIID